MLKITVLLVHLFYNQGKTINSLKTIAVELLNFAEFLISGMALLLAYLLGGQKMFLYSSPHFRFFLPSSLVCFGRKFPAGVSITFPRKCFEVYGLLVRQGSLQSPFPLDTSMPRGLQGRGTGIWKRQLSELHRMPFRHFHTAGDEPVALSTAEGDLPQARLALGSWEARQRVNYGCHLSLTIK